MELFWFLWWASAVAIFAWDETYYWHPENEELMRTSYHLLCLVMGIFGPIFALILVSAGANCESFDNIRKNHPLTRKK